LGSGAALKTALASPWDLAFYPDKNTIAIANAGTHQLWIYDRREETVSILAGNGRESIDDGRLPFNSLSQPSGLSVAGDKLYFVDSETSSLRVYEDGKGIDTLIGTGLFDFGLKDGDRDDALMQHAIGVYADNGAVYIADTYNHKIREYKNSVLSTLPVEGLKEPNDIQKIGDAFYIADTNNHRILRMERQGNQVTYQVVEIMPAEKPLAYQDSLPNTLDLGTQTIAAGATIKIDLPKNWHINKDAPSYAAVFDTDKKLIQQFDKDDVRSQKITLKNLEPGKTYFLQGILYYCEDTFGAQCLIRGFTVQLNVTPDGAALLSIVPPIK
jgi:hypothetical protein